MTALSIQIVSLIDTWGCLFVADFQTEVIQMAEEHEARQPYKCAVCGAKFIYSQDQLQNHLENCTQTELAVRCLRRATP